MKKLVFTLLFYYVMLFAENHTYLIENDSVYDVFREQVQKQNTVILNSGFKILGPGDRILFKSGEKFTGQFYVQNQSGTSENPIIIDSYSLDSNKAVIIGLGEKPVITHQSPEKSADSGFRALYFKNSQCWEIRNLCIENSGGGIAFLFFNGVNFEHIYIKNCEVKDITGQGIMIANPGKDWNKDYLISKGNDIRVQSNVINNCGKVGIYILQGWNGEFTSWVDNNIYMKNWFTNVIVNKNRIDDVGNNGIIVWGADSPIVDYNFVKKAGKGIVNDSSNGKGWGQGIFVSFTSKALIQYNEVCDNEYTFFSNLNKGDGDAGGIGIDYFSYDTICQNNYIHDNAQNGIAIMANFSPDRINKNIQNPRPVIRAIVRNNICINNSKTPDLFIKGTKQYSEAQEDPDYPEGHLNDSKLTDGEYALIWWQSRCGEIRISGPADDCQIYDNVFISSDNAYQMISEESWWGYPQSISWENNIFYSTNNADIKFEYLGGGNKFVNNKFNFELKDQNWTSGLSSWHPKKTMLFHDPELYNTDNIEHKIEKNGSEKWTSPKPIIVE